MKRGAEMSDAELCEETLALHGRTTSEPWTVGDGSANHTGHGRYFLLAGSREPFVLAEFNQTCAYVADVDLAARYRTLAPELARRLRERDAELTEIRQALDIGPGEPIDGEIVEAIEELQQQAARVAELERIVALLKCDAGRGQAS